MGIRIETEETLKSVLLGIVEEKEILFNGGYAKESDGRLYQGLVGAHDALMTGARLRYQEALKRLESVEAGCKVRLKPEYWGKFESCVAFLRAEIGRMYVTLIEKGADHVRQWLEELKSLYTGSMYTLNV
jgi:hypothetical protein